MCYIDVKLCEGKSDDTNQRKSDTDSRYTCCEEKTKKERKEEPKVLVTRVRRDQIT